MNEIDMLRRLGDEIPAPDQPTVNRLHARLREHIDQRAGAKQSRWSAMRWPKTAPGGLFAVLGALLLSVAAWTPRGLPRRWWSWLRRSNSIALAIGVLVISGSAAAGVISLSASSSQPLTGKVPGVIRPASLAGYRYAITVTPNLDAGEAFWNTAITYSNGHGSGTGSGGGSLYATLSNPLFGADTDSFVASWPSVSRRGDTVGYVLSGPQVAAVRLGSHTIRTFSSPELPARDRAAVFLLPAGSPILTSGWRPGEPIRSVMHITPASVGLTPGMPGYRGPANIPTLAVIPLDAHGNAIASHPKMPSSPFPYFWQAPSAITPSNQAAPYRGRTHPLPGVCELAQDGLPALRAEWGHAIHELSPVNDSVGELFLSCVDTEYYLHGWPLKVGVLLDARRPGQRLGAIPGAKPVPGRRDTVDFKGGHLTARRSGNAWLVVQGGSGIVQRLRVLHALRISKLDVASTKP